MLVLRKHKVEPSFSLCRLPCAGHFESGWPVFNNCSFDIVYDLFRLVLNSMRGSPDSNVAGGD